MPKSSTYTDKLNSAQLDALESLRARQSANSSAAKNKKNNRGVKVFGWLALGVIAIGAIAASTPHNSSTAGLDSSSTSQDNSGQFASDPTPDTSWVPKGMSIYLDDTDIAWVFDNKENCSILGENGCIHIKVATNRECSSDLYVEANELDKSGNIIGMTNASLGHLRIGQIANLELDALSADTVKFQLSKINCL